MDRQVGEVALCGDDIASPRVRSTKLDLASDSPEREDFTQLVGYPGST
jgi:hypothetical protein